MSGRLMDAGNCALFQVSSSESASVPGAWSLSELVTLPFQELVVSNAHFYDAQRANQTVDRTIRMWWDPSLSGLIHTASTVALLNDRYYRILKLTVTADRDGLPVFDLDLRDDDDGIRRKLNP